MRTDGDTVGMTRLIGALLDNAKAPKIYFHEEIKRSDYNSIILPTILR
jgi:hypothetical protein